MLSKVIKNNNELCQKGTVDVQYLLLKKKESLDASRGKNKQTSGSQTFFLPYLLDQRSISLVPPKSIFAHLEHMFSTASFSSPAYFPFPESFHSIDGYFLFLEPLMQINEENIYISQRFSWVCQWNRANVDRTGSCLSKLEHLSFSLSLLSLRSGERS